MKDLYFPSNYFDARKCNIPWNKNEPFCYFVVALITFLCLILAGIICRTILKKGIYFLPIFMILIVIVWIILKQTNGYIFGFDIFFRGLCW